jgi:hypothetical protein
MARMGSGEVGAAGYAPSQLFFDMPAVQSIRYTTFLYARTGAPRVIAFPNTILQQTL